MSLVKVPKRTALGPLMTDLESWFSDLFRDDFKLKPTHLPKALSGEYFPPVNLKENGKEFVVTVELPGLDEKDLDVQLLGNHLLVTGERKWEQEQKDEEYHRVESQFGAFRRTIPLPEGVATTADKIEATFTKGMLEIRLPKTEPKPLAKVKVVTK